MHRRDMLKGAGAIAVGVPMFSAMSQIAQAQEKGDEWNMFKARGGMTYVTSDTERAMKTLHDSYGIRNFMPVTEQALDVTVIDGPGAKPKRGIMRLRFMLTPGLEFIEDLGSDFDHFPAHLPADGSKFVVFHSTSSVYRETEAEFDAHMARLGPDHVRSVEFHGTPGVRSYFTDERQRLGHFYGHVYHDPAIRKRRPAQP